MIDNVVTLIGRGFTEEQVLDMPLNKFFLYVESAGRLMLAERKANVADTTKSIQMALSGKGFKQYMETLDG